MKKVLFLVAITTMFQMQSCKTSSQTETDVKPNASTEVKQSTANDVVQKLTLADFKAKVMDFEKNAEKWVYAGDKPCVIDFYADWCAPCRMTSPILDELAKEYAGKVIFYKVDTQKEQQLAGMFGIQSIPTFLYCPMDGQPTINSGIARTPEETKKIFKETIDKILLGQL